MVSLASTGAATAGIGGVGRGGIGAASGNGNGIPGIGGKGAGGRVRLDCSGADFFLFFLNPMTSPTPKGEQYSIEPYLKKPQNLGYLVMLWGRCSPPSLKN